MEQTANDRRQQTPTAAEVQLLRTKLALPRLSAQLVPRPALLARLDQGLERKPTLISAPAGFGKTTLAGQWLATRGQRPDPQPVAWVALDAGDNDPVRFWRYVLTACQSFPAPGEKPVGSEALALLHIPGQPPVEAILTSLINDLAQLSTPAILVLEDYHLVESRQIHEMMIFLLDHLPATLHLVMLTRQDPPFPLARLRARHELHELGPFDLRFSAAETETFLRQAIPFSLSEEAIDRLAARTEGWAAGLRLVVLALQGRQEPQEIEQFLVDLTGSHGHILDYLAQEVLHVQPEPIQAFLLQTAFLDRLTAPLCDVVTGRKDSAQLLEQLVRANLFLIPLDGTGRWYRYHGLFAEAMRHYAQRPLAEMGMDEAEVLALRERASSWYEAHGLLDEAIETALGAQVFARAAALITQLIGPQRVVAEYHTLRRWLDQLPDEVLETHPTLCLTYALAIQFTSDRRSPATFTLLQSPLEMAERTWQAEGNRPKLGAVQAVRALAAWWQGDLVQSFTAARQALAYLPEDDLQWRAVILTFTGMEELLDGQLHVAHQTVAEARTLNEAAGNIYGKLSAMHMLGMIDTMQGELQQAAQVYRQVLAESEAAPMEREQALIDQAWALTGLAALYLEWNELVAAGEAAAQARAIGEQLGEEYHQVHGTLILARVLQAQGQTAEAQELLHSLVARFSQQQWPFLRREVEAGQARLRLASGDLAAVQRWQASWQDQGAAIPRIQQEAEALIVARLLLAQGKAVEALHLLESCRSEAHVQGRIRSALEMALLMALAHYALNHLSQAKQTLIAVLAQAQTEGYQRLFLDEGEAMAILLREILRDLKQEPLAQYVRDLLLGFAEEHGATEAKPLPAAALLVEPLSPQEQRVLRLLAAGLSNPEIAQELVVSINTVKTQVQSIYTKLDVHSREEARDVARQLKLL